MNMSLISYKKTNIVYHLLCLKLNIKAIVLFVFYVTEFFSLFIYHK